MKLGIGTVQFGCNYGISNKTGQVSLKEVSKILNYAQEKKIDTLDTACMYGNSEEVLGKFDLSSFKVITKTIRANNRETVDYNVKNLERNFLNSLENLRQASIYGLLFHEANDLIFNLGDALWAKVEEFKRKKYVDKIGVSVYTPEQLIQIIDKFDIDIVQLPLNILDQRFVYLMKELKSKGIEIHTRSTFLQGLLLMKNDEINPYFDEIKPLLNQIPEPKLSYALQYVNSLSEVDKIIVGTTSLNDLKEIVESNNKKIVDIDYNIFKIDDEKFLMPQNWRLK